MFIYYYIFKLNKKNNNEDLYNSKNNSNGSNDFEIEFYDYEEYLILYKFY